MSKGRSPADAKLVVGARLDWRDVTQLLGSTLGSRLCSSALEIGRLEIDVRTNEVAGCSVRGRGFLVVPVLGGRLGARGRADIRWKSELNTPREVGVPTEIANRRTVMHHTEPQTLESARPQALQFLAALEQETGYELVLLDEETRELEFGWLFVFNTREFQTTQNPLLGLAGNGPLVVDQELNTVCQLPSRLSTEAGLAEYRATRLQGGGGTVSGT